MRFNREIPVISEPDVLVCGAGCAGVGAAIAAAESGASVLVVESAGFPGGFITAVTGPGLDGMFDTVTGEIVVGGITQDVMEKVSGISRERQQSGRFTYGGDLTAQSGVDSHKAVDTTGALTPVEMNPEHFKRYAELRCTQLGIEVLYHTRITAVETDGSLVEAVVMANKDGLVAVRPRIVLDCTGDADVAAWAGDPVMTNPEAQPMSLHFRIGDVELSDTLIANCSRALKDASTEGLVAAYGGPWVLRMGPRDITVNATRIRADHSNARDWTRAEVEGRAQAWQIIQIWKERVPECRHAYYISSGPEAGARETRRIAGQYVLTGADILSQRRFEDAVVQGAWYFDQHPAAEVGFHPHRPARPYDIPYRTLVPQRSSNLLVAGRCHSATPDALASSRVTGTAMGMGEAAGTAAGIALEAGVLRLADVPAWDLRKALLARGAILV